MSVEHRPGIGANTKAGLLLAGKCAFRSAGATVIRPRLSWLACRGRIGSWASLAFGSLPW